MTQNCGRRDRDSIGCLRHTVACNKSLERAKRARLQSEKTRFLALQTRAMNSEPPRKRSKWDSLEPASDPKEAELKARVKKQKRKALPAASTSQISQKSTFPLLAGCRSVYNYERLNHIEEGSYGVVSRARDKETGDMCGFSLELKVRLGQA